MCSAPPNEFLEHQHSSIVVFSQIYPKCGPSRFLHQFYPEFSPLIHSIFSREYAQYSIDLTKEDQLMNYFLGISIFPRETQIIFLNFDLPNIQFPVLNTIRNSIIYHLS